MSLEQYKAGFTPVHGYWFTWFLVRELREKRGCFDVTLDIGLSTSRVCMNGSELSVGELVVNLDDVVPGEDDRVVLLEKSGDKYEVVYHSSKGFYKLKAVGVDKAPTLEINGIHMHRVTGVDPWRDTLLKVHATGVSPGNVVLDTCMGLGYTAIASLYQGAREVYTFEVDETVIWVAERNPWSRGLSDQRVKMHLGDVTELVHLLPDSYFHRVIHDPPRFTRSTGDLYSLEFYSELYRVLKPRGLLFHYTGEPWRRGGPSVLKGIKERLGRAGFRVLRYDQGAQGFVALKPW